MKTTQTKMTTAEKTSRVRVINQQWYRDFAKYGEKIADETLNESMNRYFDEMVERGGA